MQDRDRNVQVENAKLLQAMSQGAPTRVFAKNNPTVGHTDRSGAHNFVGERVCQYTVLMDAGFVGKRIASYNGLIRRGPKPMISESNWLVGYRRSSTSECVQGNLSLRTSIAAAISSKAAFPARSPMPLMVHSTCCAPAATAARVLATAKPRSLWQWDESVTPATCGRRVPAASQT